MPLRVMLTLVLVGATLFGTGWWCRGRFDTEDPVVREPQPADEPATSSPGPSRDLEQRAEELEIQLNRAALKIEQQCQTLREMSLGSQGRTVEDLIALLPAPFPAGDWRPAEGLVEDCWFEASDGVRLHGWYAAHSEPKALILFLHGNAGNVTHRIEAIMRLRQQCMVSVLVADYRGYGRSEGRPTISGLLRDARAARDYLAEREGVEPSQIVLLGRSLGGALAVELAAVDGAAGLILESTFASLRQAAATHYPGWAVQLLVSKRLDSVDSIGNYHGPLLISHGDADRTIPINQARQLYERANDPKALVVIRGGDHNDRQSQEYYQAVTRLLSRVQSPQ